MTETQEPHFDDATRGPSKAWLTRRRAAYVLAAFVALSFAVHFVLGPAVTVLSPSWRYPNMPEQAITIISVSKIEQQRIVPKPTPQPSPTPIIVKRTNFNLALVQLREMVNSNSLGHNKIRPANKRVDIELRHLVKLKPNRSRTAPLVAAQMRLQPPSRKLAMSARVDTGGASDSIGATQWGDDNPPQLISQAPAGGSVPGRAARIKVDIGPDGVVTAVTLEQSSGDPAYDNAALEAARHSTYAPATLNGLPVHGSLVVEYPAAASAT